MEQSLRGRGLRRSKDHRIVLHFDYDCFYASVFEAENPALKSLPLAVQQKQIIVTCNYEARRRGLRKLQLIREAKKVCPDVVIVLGEDLTRFRNASKELYNFLRAYSWNGKVERLGFDEVFMDVTDMIDYNMSVLNTNDLANSFFCISRDDPTLGFPFDASCVAGHTYQEISEDYDVRGVQQSDSLHLRLRLGSLLAQYLRHQLEERKGYTSTVGISTSKLLSKLVGNLHKPRSQTTLMPPYVSDDGKSSNVTTFLDEHEIGKIPGIGFKTAQKIRDHVLRRSAESDAGLVYGGTREAVSVLGVRMSPGMSAETLEKLLNGPGLPHGIGFKLWGLLNGIDDTEVDQAREMPRQISIEDSYVRLDTIPEVLKELETLSRSLVRRMRLDLVEEDDAEDVTVEQTGEVGNDPKRRRWLAHPRTIRLSTRPRPPMNPDGTRTRSFNRISRSAPLPNFVFSLTEHVDALAEKLVSKTLTPLFRQLHPEKSGWDLSLLNVAVTNMVDTAGDSKSATGRDIARMFERQEDVLKQWNIEDRDVPLEAPPHSLAQEELQNKTEILDGQRHGSEDLLHLSQHNRSSTAGDDSDSEEQGLDSSHCSICGAVMPPFAMAAHQRFHSLGE